ncbi:type II toxin-antitoxin system RelE family toxin [Actinocorallia populi]|uniref:type II toxin-antitoxin system RelE family toxin n=1 Tax=Actinocorallia populi TaxID=2079200 RepID=UPI000D0899D7|nr:type II toxin-antitoxin system RelE/ParE family toxin [Actinocorallia populi]
MIYAIIWTLSAARTLRDFRERDPEGAGELRAAIETLAADPRPDDSSPYGPAYRRLRVGRYRVMYRIEEKEISVIVLNLARSTP